MSVSIDGSGKINGIDQGLNVVGVVTGTTFDGNVTGNITGNITGDVTGNVSAPTSLNVGVTTFHSTQGFIHNLNSTGVITATSFSGDGSNLTGIDATQIQTGNTSVQTVDTGSDGHVKVTTEGTERLRVTSTGAVGIGSDFTAIETTGGGGITLDSGVGGGQIGVFLKSTGYTGNQTKLWQDSANAVSYLESTERPLIIKAGDGAGDYIRMDVGGSERARILSTGDLKLNHGLTGLTGGGVLVCASSSNSSSSGSWPQTVDFTIPMGNLSSDYDNAVKNYYSSGETGATYGSSAGSACLLLASCWNTYYWGYATKLYLCTVYGQSSKTTALQQLHSYSAAGHPNSSASISLSVVSTNNATPKLKATFSGDYWNSNAVEVVMFGGGFASPACLGPTALSSLHANLTGQDAAWK